MNILQKFQPIGSTNFEIKTTSLDQLFRTFQSCKDKIVMELICEKMYGWLADLLGADKAKRLQNQKYC